MDPITRIEQKLDKLHDKMDSYTDRLAKVEMSLSWMKWALSLLLTVSGTAAVAFSKYLGT